MGCVEETAQQNFSIPVPIQQRLQALVEELFGRRNRKPGPSLLGIAGLLLLFECDEELRRSVVNAARVSLQDSDAALKMAKEAFGRWRTAIERADPATGLESPQAADRLADHVQQKRQAGQSAASETPDDNVEEST